MLVPDALFARPQPATIPDESLPQGPTLPREWRGWLTALPVSPAAPAPPVAPPSNAATRAAHARAHAEAVALSMRKNQDACIARNANSMTPHKREILERNEKEIAKAFERAKK